eukprot:scaffold909_cov575-Prasinococcus_capsulatus_cf.AAC.15
MQRRAGNTHTSVTVHREEVVQAHCAGSHPLLQLQYTPFELVALGSGVVENAKPRRRSGVVLVPLGYALLFVHPDDLVLHAGLS